MSTVNPESGGKSPLYRRIQQNLRERIERGDWLDGHALPNRRSLCAEFGTSRVTLDKAIQGLMQEGFVRGVAGSGTFVCSPARRDTPSPEASALVRVLNIGVVLGRHMPPEMNDADDCDCVSPSSDNFFFGPLFHGIRDGMSGQSVQVTYAHVESGEYLDFFEQSHLDGMLLIAPSLNDLPTLRRLAAALVPFVALAISSDACPEDAALPCVDANNRQGAYEAVQHLIGLGHQRVALINLAMSHANHHDRMLGYQRALTAAQLSMVPDDIVAYPVYNASVFEGVIEAWLCRAESSGELPTAVFASDYLMTLALLRVLRLHRLRVPEDISVVSFDDPLSAAHLAPPLTTVRQPTYRLGRRAAQRLVDYLNAAGASPLRGTELLSNELIVRDSTAAPAVTGKRCGRVPVTV